MRYSATPAFYVSVESGKSFGPPMMVETAPLESGEALADPSKDKNVVVVTLENAMRLAGEPGKTMDVYALHPRDASNLCRDLLLHCSSLGDRIARKLCERLLEIIEEEKG